VTGYVEVVGPRGGAVGPRSVVGPATNGREISQVRGVVGGVGECVRVERRGRAVVVRRPDVFGGARPAGYVEVVGHGGSAVGPRSVVGPATFEREIQQVRGVVGGVAACVRVARAKAVVVAVPGLPPEASS